MIGYKMNYYVLNIDCLQNETQEQLCKKLHSSQIKISKLPVELIETIISHMDLTDIPKFCNLNNRNKTICKNFIPILLKQYNITSPNNLLFKIDKTITINSKPMEILNSYIYIIK